MHHVICSAFRPSLASQSRRAISTAVAPVTDIIVNARPSAQDTQSILIDALGNQQYGEFTALCSGKSPLGSAVKKYLRRRLLVFVERYKNTPDAGTRKKEVKNLRQEVAKLSKDAGMKISAPAVRQVMQTVFKNGPLRPSEPPLTKLKQQDGMHGWRGEEWGVDTLEFKGTTQFKRKNPPPSAFTRRVEGVFSPLSIPILEDVLPKSEHKPIAKLAHNLDRVLFNPGVHWLQDPRTGVYNFISWLENVPSVDNFAFDRVSGFITSSRDEDMLALAKEEGRLFAGSTSSLSGILSHIYFLISGDMPVNTYSLSKSFEDQPRNFTPGQRMPVSVLLKHKDGVYSIDSFDEGREPEKNILTWMGVLLEKFFTRSPEDFKSLLRDSPNPAKLTDTRREAYRYCKTNKLVMRAQLDCRDPRLPGTGVFDLKTRAVLPVRLDHLNYQEYAGYEIRKLNGLLGSFEVEYYDLIRSAFLKYTFQARIGNMDGVLVAHHNAARIFGFQYIPLTDMESCLYGGSDRGQQVFEKCVLLLEEVLIEVIACFPNQSVRCLVETLEKSGYLRLWVEPEHVEKEGPRPIVQLDVQVSNVIESQYVKGKAAIAAVDDQKPWSMHWKISRCSKSEESIRIKKQEAEERRFRAFSLPSGVDIEEMESIWNQIDYSGKGLSGEGEHTSFDSSRFRPANPRLKKLRKLSRTSIDRVKAVEDGQTEMNEPSISEFNPRPQVDSVKLLYAMGQALPDRVEELIHSEADLSSPTSPSLASDVNNTPTNVATNTPVTPLPLVSDSEPEGASDVEKRDRSNESQMHVPKDDSAVLKTTLLDDFNLATQGLQDLSESLGADPAEDTSQLLRLQEETPLSSANSETSRQDPTTKSTSINDILHSNTSSDSIEVPPEANRLDLDPDPEWSAFVSSLYTENSGSSFINSTLEVNGVQDASLSPDGVHALPEHDLLMSAHQSSDTAIIEDEKTIPSIAEVANSDSSPADLALEVDGIQSPNPSSDGVEALLSEDTNQSSNPAIIESEEESFASSIEAAESSLADPTVEVTMVDGVLDPNTSSNFNFVRAPAEADVSEKSH